VLSGTETGRVTSPDGTSIVFDRSGAGPAVVLVHGAFTGRAPYHADESAPRLPPDFAARLDALIGKGRRADAVELFMVETAAVPAEAVAAMRRQPSWPDIRADCRLAPPGEVTYRAGEAASVLKMIYRSA
jgi:hypothetical protein